MVNVVERMEQAAANCAMGVIDAGVAIQQWARPGIERVSWWMHDIYSLDGFEKWTKAVIADLRFISLIPSIRGTFDECIKTLEAQKDLYYATLFIGATAEDFMYKDGATGAMRFKLPRYCRRIDPNLPGEKVDPRLPENFHGRIDFVRLLYGIGHYFEALKFLQKYKVFSFSTATQLANTIGAYKVFNRRLDEIPVVLNLFDKPKDSCIFFASAIAFGIEFDKVRNAGTINFDNLIKFTSCTGKMTLIFFGKHYNQAWWFAAIDVVTQNASLIALIRKRNVERQRRFDNP